MGVRFQITKNHDSTKRLIAAESSGFHVGDEFTGISRVITNADPPTMMASVVKRIGNRPPHINFRNFKLFYKYVDIFLETFLVPLESDTDLSFETWLSHTSYTERQKIALTKLHVDTNGVYDRDIHRHAKCFMKEESYDDYDKHARGIFSRVDEFKVNFGPIVKAIEHRVYQRPEFIKHVPVSDRARYLTELLCGEGIFMETDYTAYESHFTSLMMQLLDLHLFRYMTKNIQNDQIKLMANDLSEINKLIFTQFTAQLPASRLSGEMTTSLFNGFANWVTNSFVIAYSNWHKNSFDTIPISFDALTLDVIDREWVLKHYRPMGVEGDDGLTLNPFPISSDLFKEIGFTIKIEIHERIGGSKFCGILFAEESLDTLTDPIKQLINFGWVPGKYVGAKKTVKLALLRSKAMSLLSSFPNCPIVAPAAKAVVRLTNRYHSSALRILKRTDKFLLGIVKVPAMLISPQISIHSRMVIEDHFHIPIERQFLIENWFNSLSMIKPIPYDLVDMEISRDFVEFSERYVLSLTELKSKHVEFNYNLGPTEIDKRYRHLITSIT